jgi:hypothetical protein
MKEHTLRAATSIVNVLIERRKGKVRSESNLQSSPEILFAVVVTNLLLFSYYNRSLVLSMFLTSDLVNILITNELFIFYPLKLEDKFPRHEAL